MAKKAPKKSVGGHATRVQDAKECIDEVFGDTTITPSETRDSLVEIKEYIESKLNALDIDAGGDSDGDVDVYDEDSE